MASSVPTCTVAVLEPITVGGTTYPFGSTASIPEDAAINYQIAGSVKITGAVSKACQDTLADVSQYPSRLEQSRAAESYYSRLAC